MVCQGARKGWPSHGSQAWWVWVLQDYPVMQGGHTGILRPVGGKARIGHVGHPPCWGPGNTHSYRSQECGFKWERSEMGSCQKGAWRWCGNEEGSSSIACAAGREGPVSRRGIPLIASLHPSLASDWFFQTRVWCQRLWSPIRGCSSFSHPAQDLCTSEQKSLGLRPVCVCVCTCLCVCAHVLLSLGLPPGELRVTFPAWPHPFPLQGNKSHFLISAWLPFEFMILVSSYLNLTGLSFQIQDALTWTQLALVREGNGGKVVQNMWEMKAGLLADNLRTKWRKLLEGFLLLLLFLHFIICENNA